MINQTKNTWRFLYLCDQRVNAFVWRGYHGCCKQKELVKIGRGIGTYLNFTNNDFSADFAINFLHQTENKCEYYRFKSHRRMSIKRQNSCYNKKKRR